MKKLLAFITIASLTLGTSTFVFADEVPDTEAPEGIEETVDEETEEPEAEAPAEETAEETAPVAVEPVPLKYTEDSYIYEIGSTIIGVYPVLTDNAALTSKITDLIKASVDTEVANEYEINTTNVISYEVVEQATAAMITINMLLPNLENNVMEPTAIGIFYVNTITSEEITAEEYEALIIPEAPEGEAAEGEEAPEGEETETPEVEAPEEPVMVPIRLHAEALGYEVIWNESGSVEIKNEAASTVITLDQNVYTTFAGETVQLNAAPVFIEGTVYVPTTFFSDILGANVTFGADGNAVIVAGAPAEEVAEGEEAPAEEVAEGEEAPETEGEEVPAETEEDTEAAAE